MVFPSWGVVTLLRFQPVLSNRDTPGEIFRDKGGVEINQANQHYLIVTGREFLTYGHDSYFGM